MHFTTKIAIVKLMSTSYNGTLIYLTSNYATCGLLSRYMSASIDYILYKLLKNSSYITYLWSMCYYLFLLHCIYLFIYLFWMPSVRHHTPTTFPAHLPHNCFYQCLYLIGIFSTLFYYVLIFLTLHHPFLFSIIYTHIYHE